MFTTHSDLSPFSLGVLQCISSVLLVLKDKDRLLAAALSFRIFVSSSLVFLFHEFDATDIGRSSTYEEVKYCVLSISRWSDRTYMTKSNGDRGEPWGIPLFTVLAVLGLPGYTRVISLVATKFLIQLLIYRGTRSEERRVGKESRSRESP